MKKLFLLLLIGMGSPFLFGQEQEFPFVDNNLPEVVITSTPIRDSLQRIPASINVVSSANLDRADASSLANEFNKVPGVLMQQGAVNTSRITLRGLGARSQYSTNRVKAYLEGIPLTTGEGETTLEDIDLNLIDNIEIIKGPNSSLYGAGLGGVISLKAKKPQTNSTGLDIYNAGGSYGYYQGGVRAYTASEKTSLQLGYNYLNKDGFRENSNYDRHNISLLGSVNFSTKSKLTAFGLYTNLKAFIPSSINREDFENTPESAAFTWKSAKGYESYDKLIAGISHSYTFSNQFSNTTSIFINHRDGYEPRPFDILDENQTALGARTLFNYSAQQIPLKISVGAEYLNEDYTVKLYDNLYEENNGNGSLEGANFSDIDQRRSYINTFAQVNYDITSRLKLDLGANINSTKYTLDDQFVDDGDNISGAYTYDVQFSPRVGLTYEAFTNQFIYATVSNGFSTPTVAETLTPEGAINTSIQPEVGTNYEVGFKASWFKDQRLYTELALYTIQVNDLLVAQRVGQDQYVGVNAGKTDHNGLEFLFSYSQPLSSQWVLKPYGSLTINDYSFEEFIDEDADYSDNDLTGVPDKIINLGLDIVSVNDLQVNINYRHQGAIPLNDANSLYSDSYNLVNFKVKQGFNIGNTKASIFGGINNVFDTNYAAQILPNAVGFGGSDPRFYYPGEPINFYAGLDIRL